MNANMFDRMTARERYEYLRNVNVEDMMGDRPANVPNPAQVAGLNFNQLPAAYQIAVAA